MIDKKAMDPEKLVVFYDATCPFCIRWIKFLLDRDGNDALRFAALQSEWAHAFLREKGLKHPGMGSILVWDGKALLSESSATMTIARALPGIWQVGAHLDIFPKSWRDKVYTFIAQRRYSWFGKRDECWEPDKADRWKFLDQKDRFPQDEKHESGSGDDPAQDKR